MKTDLDTVIFKFEEEDGTTDLFTYRDMMLGLMMFGAIGTGKSSGGGQFVAAEMLSHGFGGLILTAKGEETQTWLDYAKRMGRSQDVILINESNQNRFNFLDYENKRSKKSSKHASRGGGLTRNIYDIFGELSEVITTKEKADGYFSKTAESVFIYVVTLLKVFRKTLSVEEIVEMVGSLPTSDADLQDPNRFFNQLEARANQHFKQNPSDKTTSDGKDILLALRYLKNNFKDMPEKQRGGVTGVFDTLLDPFLLGNIREQFCTTTNVVPEDTFDGKLIIVDYPTLEYGKEGRIIQVIWKMMWQRAVKARITKNNQRPVFLWADECQEFVTQSDRPFLNVMRSQYATVVYLTQNIPNMVKLLGKEGTDALLSGFRNFLYHQNDCTKTNSWAAEKVGREWQAKYSFNTQTAGEQERGGSSVSDSYHFKLDPTYFQDLMYGSTNHNLLVEAVFWRASDPWVLSGMRYRDVVFIQDFIEREYRKQS